VHVGTYMYTYRTNSVNFWNKKIAHTDQIIWTNATNYMLGGPKIGFSPQTQGSRTTFTRVTKWDKESPKAGTHLKSCESIYTCPHAPFIGRWRDFYILKIPSNLRNIPSVNMYMNVFYIPWFAGLISYIYKPATSSHVKSDSWGDVFDLASRWFPNLLYMKIFIRHNLRI
jgi:hypothetical protein